MIATTIEQSKKLVELGIDISTADMCWCNNSVKGVNYTDNYALHTHTVQELKSVFDEAFTCWDKYWKLIPAWSLGALLDIIKKTIGYTLQTTYNKDPKVFIICELGEKPYSIASLECDNEVDACVEMIIKLHEQNLL